MLWQLKRVSGAGVNWPYVSMAIRMRPCAPCRYLPACKTFQPASAASASSCFGRDANFFRDPVLKHARPGTAIQMCFSRALPSSSNSNRLSLTPCFRRSPATGWPAACVLQECDDLRFGNTGAFLSDPPAGLSAWNIFTMPTLFESRSEALNSSPAQGLPAADPVITIIDNQ